MAARFLRIFSLVGTYQYLSAVTCHERYQFDRVRARGYLYLISKRTIFTIGPPDPNKTIFVRQSSTVVCTAGIAHLMTIEPRDEYDNLCTFGPGDKPTEGYNVNITQVRHQNLNAA